MKARLQINRTKIPSAKDLSAFDRILSKIERLWSDTNCKSAKVLEPTVKRKSMKLKRQSVSACWRQKPAWFLQTTLFHVRS
jgi:hypothetical protein